MKALRLITLSLVLSLLLFNCSNDDDDTTTDVPEPVNEEEVITTLTVVLTPATGPAITLETTDLDGDGPNLPVVNVSGNFTPNTTYSGVITLLNETEDPAEDITEEVEEESNEHQFFFTIADGLNVTTTYANNDDNGNPLGTQLTLETGASSTGTITFTLRHEPKKPNNGTLMDAGGETDISAPFPIDIL